MNSSPMSQKRATGLGAMKPRELGRQIVFYLKMLLIPWSRVLEKLLFTQLVKKFPVFYENLRFITVFTRARY